MMKFKPVCPVTGKEYPVFELKYARGAVHNLSAGECSWHLSSTIWAGHKPILCAFTGLQDCDGNDIFEGDVLKFDDILAGQLFLVRFVDCSYVLWPSDELGVPDLLFGNEPILKIIGNRWQPEFREVFGDT